MRSLLAACSAAVALACCVTVAGAEERLDVTVVNATDRPLRLYWFDDDRTEGPVPPGERAVTAIAYRTGSFTHLEIAVADAPPRPHDFTDKCWVRLSAAGAYSVTVTRGETRLDCRTDR